MIFFVSSHPLHYLSTAIVLLFSFLCILLFLDFCYGHLHLSVKATVMVLGVCMAVCWDSCYHANCRKPTWIL